MTVDCWLDQKNSKTSQVVMSTVHILKTNYDNNELRSCSAD